MTPEEHGAMLATLARIERSSANAALAAEQSLSLHREERAMREAMKLRQDRHAKRIARIETHLEMIPDEGEMPSGMHYAADVERILKEHELAKLRADEKKRESDARYLRRESWTLRTKLLVGLGFVALNFLLAIGAAHYLGGVHVELAP